MARILRRFGLWTLPWFLALFALSAAADARPKHKSKRRPRIAQTAPAPAAPAPAAPAPAPMPAAAPTGALVVAVGEGAQPHAKELARVVYDLPVLRPGIDEATAQVLSGGDPPADNPALAGHAAVVRALATTSEDEAQRRLAGSLARDLNARLVILVSLPPAAEGVEPEPVARVVRMPEEQFLAVKLTPTRKPDAAPGDAAGWEWSGAASVLKDLSIESAPEKPKPHPRAARKPKPKRHGAPVPKAKGKGAEEGDDDGNLLTSPWFWGGLGLVVTVGATVLILSQTALNEPDTVSIGGRIGP